MQPSEQPSGAGDDGWGEGGEGRPSPDGEVASGSFDEADGDSDSFGVGVGAGDDGYNEEPEYADNYAASEEGSVDVAACGSMYSDEYH